MRAILAAATFCVAIGAALAAVPQDPQQRPPIFRGEANFVQVDAYVLRDGRAAEGLTAADFEVLEDGIAQKIETFEFIRVEPSPNDLLRIDPTSQAEGERLAADPRNRVFVVYLDTFGTSPEGAKRAWPPLVEFLQRYMAPTDLFGVLTPLTRVRDLVFARRLESAESMLSKYWIWAREEQLRLTPDETFLEQCYIVRTPLLPTNIRIGRDLIRLWRLDRLLSGLEETIANLGALRDERKMLILVSDGWIAEPPAKDLLQYLWGSMPTLGVQRGRLGTGTGQPNQQDHAKCDAEMGRLTTIDFERRQDRLAEQATRANVSFFPVVSQIAPWPSGMAAFDPGPRGTLRRLAEDTDGRYVVNEIREGLTRIGQDLSAYYLLGYYSTNTKTDGRYRRIQVKVNSPGVTLTARRGYLAPTVSLAAAAAASRTAAAAVVGPPAGIVDALKPLARLSSPPDVFMYGVVHANELVLVTELSTARGMASVWRQGADLQVNLAAAEGGAAMTGSGRLEAAARSAIVRVPLPPGATGPWRATVKITANGESLDDHATIDRATHGPLLASAIVYRAATLRSPLQPVADLLFRRSERVHVEWPILQPLDNRQVRVLTKAGQPVATGATITERDGNGAPMIAVDLLLAPLGAGDYVIEVTAARGAVSDRAFVAFRVGQ